MRILVLGAYGFIGSAIVRGLHGAGHEVTGFGRSARTGQRLFPKIRWLGADMARLVQPDDWAPLLRGMDLVINAAGVLQDGARDSVELVHHVSTTALVAACEIAGREHGQYIRLIQISAPGATPSATTEFMRSKSRGDDAVKRSSLDWIVLRPGFVIGTNAYGGSALIRMMAAFPLVLPIAMAAKRIHTVALSDVVQVTLEAAEGRLPYRSDLDLVEPRPHTLSVVVTSFRSWLGIAPARATLHVPQFLVLLVARIADGLGSLGWRSPMRTTAVRALEAEVVGEPTLLQRLRGKELRSLAQTLESMPATVQERWFARLYLLMPLMVATLSLFWIVSAVIGVSNVSKAAAVFPPGVFSTGAASAMVVGGAAVDLLLGVAVLIRPLARLACVGMVVTSAFYLLAATILVPALWLDPLGPLVKVIPGMLLAAVTHAILEER